MLYICRDRYNMYKNASTYTLTDTYISKEKDEKERWFILFSVNDQT